MGVLGSAINGLVDAATGGSGGTTLDTFLAKFTASSERYAEVIDPKTTFDVYMAFYPTLEGEAIGTGRKVLNALGTAATGMVKNLVSNITGGLLDLGSGSGDVMKEHDSWESNNDQTFLTYLLKANLIVGGENFFNEDQGMKPLMLSLGPYVQEVTLPHIAMDDQGKTTTLLGEFPVNGLFVKPDSNQLIMQIVNTKAALHERIFYPWMREVTLPYWSYNSQPYTTATITIDFTKHNDVKYVFHGCRPSQIHSMQGKQDTSGADNLTRQVTFIFDFMTITSSLRSKDKAWQKLLQTGGAIFNAASGTIGL